MIKKREVSEIYSLSKGKKVKIPLFICSVKAGFPSPADDYIDKKLDLNEYLIANKASTFFVKVIGDSMIGAGIFPNSILVVDRSIEVTNGKIVLAILNGEFTIKRFKKIRGKIQLIAENPKYQPIEIIEEHEFEVWGVVTSVINKT